VVYGGTRNPLYISKEYRSETLLLKVRAPHFYPDGNVGYGRTRIPPHRSKECGSVTLALRPSAPRFYPTTGKFNDLDGKCAGGRR
jgi:hypothetical protein